MNYRLFAAFSLPDDIIEQLRGTQTGLPGAGWRPRENLHITLSFFGEADGALAGDLDDELSQIDSEPFDVKISGVGSFGGKTPHSLWAGVEQSDSLMALAKDCRRAARRLGFPADKHDYKPHVTLAYLNELPDAEIAAWLQRFAMLETASFLVDRFELYASWPGKHASRYEEMAEYPLV